MLDAEMVVALGELTPSILMLMVDAVFGTRMSVPLVACPDATVMTCGVVRLPPLFDVPPPAGGGVGVVGAGVGAGVVVVVVF
jgi:hypothetical protein